MMKLSPYLIQALESVANNQGEDVEYVFGGITRKTALSYVARLKSRGLVYTCRWSRSKFEVWTTEKGRKILDEIVKARG